MGSSKNNTLEKKKKKIATLSQAGKIVMASLRNFWEKFENFSKKFGNLWKKFPKFSRNSQKFKF